MELRKVKRFQDNNGRTVIDTQTGFMWQQDMGNTMPWEEAVNYCKGLELAGFADWRLPTIQELISLVDYQIYNPAINNIFQSKSIIASYWSSTTFAGNSGAAWYVNFSYGTVYVYDKSYSFYVRAVRG